MIEKFDYLNSEDAQRSLTYDDICERYNDLARLMNNLIDAVNNGESYIGIPELIEIITEEKKRKLENARLRAIKIIRKENDIERIERFVQHFKE